jgi:acetyl-CoA C-acetyltransferase
MAMHAIKTGEGQVFISAGVEMVSRPAKGSSDSLPDTMNPLFDDARARTATAAEGGAEGWHEPRRRHAARRLHRYGPDRRERGVPVRY